MYVKIETNNLYLSKSQFFFIIKNRNKKIPQKIDLSIDHYISNLLVSRDILEIKFSIISVRICEKKPK